MVFGEITEENFLIYAAKHYYCPRAIDADEFYEELNRFKYIKRLVNRYKRGEELRERLILNHITVILNVFGNEPGIMMLMFKVGGDNLSILLPFLQYCRAVHKGDFEGIEADDWVAKKLELV